MGFEYFLNDSNTDILSLFLQSFAQWQKFFDFGNYATTARTCYGRVLGKRQAIANNLSNLQTIRCCSFKGGNGINKLSIVSVPTLGIFTP